MLPIPALPTAATMPSGGETPAAQPGAEAQGADFLALLASQSGDMTPAAPAVMEVSVEEVDESVLEAMAN